MIGAHVLWLTNSTFRVHKGSVYRLINAQAAYATPVWSQHRLLGQVFRRCMLSSAGWQTDIPLYPSLIRRSERNKNRFMPPR